MQDPDEALYSGMPGSALANSRVDYVLPLKEIPAVLARLAYEEAEDEGAYPAQPEIELENKFAEMEEISMEDIEQIGKPSAYACPECHGTLWEIQDGDLLRFRCRVGHAYGAESMLADHSESLESALWVALRALEESASLARRLAERSQERTNQRAVSMFEEKARRAEGDAKLIRAILSKDGDPSVPSQHLDMQDS